MAIDIEVGSTGVKETAFQKNIWARANRVALSRTTSLPASAPDGVIYIIPVGDPSEGEIAFRCEGSWATIVPEDGWTAYVVDDGEHVIYLSGAWIVDAGSGVVAAEDVTFDPSASGLSGMTNVQDAIDALDAIVDGLAAVTAYGKQTIWVPASAMIAATTSGPAVAQLETSSNKINYSVLDFDATADEHAHFNVAFPKSWDEGTVTFQVKWSSTATDTDGVAWGLQGVAVSDNEAIDASWGTAIVVTDDAQGAAGELYVTSESSAVTIGGSPAVGDVCFFRIFRDISDGNDDMTEDARLIGVMVFYTTNAVNDA